MKKARKLTRTNSRRVPGTGLNLSLSSIDHTMNALLSPRASSGLASPRSDMPEKVNSRKDVSKLKKVRISKLLLGNPVALMALLESVGEADVDTVAGAVSTVLAGQLQCLHVMLYCIFREVQETAAPEMILRGGGLYTRLLSMVASTTCNDFLHTILQPEVELLQGPDFPVELDPAKVAVGDDVEHNRANIVKVGKRIMKKLSRAVEDIPQVVLLICKEFYSRVKTKFPSHEGHAISGFLILRIICPALTMPENFDLVSECSPFLRRKLILVAKVLQAVFNDSLEKKEDWMQTLSSFIKTSQKSRKQIVKRIMTRKAMEGPELVKELSYQADSRVVRKAEEKLKVFCLAHARDMFPFVEVSSPSSEARVSCLERALHRESEILGHTFQGVQDAWVASAREWCFVQIFSATKNGVEKKEESLSTSGDKKKRLHARVRSLGDIFDMGKDAIGGKSKDTSSLPPGDSAPDIRLPAKETLVSPRQSPFKEPRVQYYRFCLHHDGAERLFTVRKGSTHLRRLRSIAAKQLGASVTSMRIDLDGKQQELTQMLLEEVLPGVDDCLHIHVTIAPAPVSSSDN